MQENECDLDSGNGYISVSVDRHISDYCWSFVSASTTIPTFTLQRLIVMPHCRHDRYIIGALIESFLSTNFGHFCFSTKALCAFVLQ